jgi:hypothetical protein
LLQLIHHGGADACSSTLCQHLYFCTSKQVRLYKESKATCSVFVRLGHPQRLAAYRFS